VLSEGGQALEIHVLGEAWACAGSGEPLRLERKTAALVAYLALEGPTARARLVGLLWPESRQTTARNNLRQLLHRLKELVGQECIDGGDPLRLHERLLVDVLQLRSAFAIGEYAAVTSFQGELLGGFAYEDCDELEKWLEGWRERLRVLLQEAIDREVQRLEAEGLLPAALDAARRLLSLEPTSETAYRHVMRLCHLLGDRAAALEAYRQCREVLRREFSIEPSEATRELARDIEAHEAVRRMPSPVPRLVLPLTVVSPPVLVGREREWALLEEAWAARRPMLVVGEEGIGKTRLMADFARDRGRQVAFSARPGDRLLPFSTHARTARGLLALQPGTWLTSWVRRELSRLVPELEPAPLPLPRSPEEKARLFQAVVELLHATLRGVDILLFDDLQYMDRESLELGIYACAELREEIAAGHIPVVINARRPFEPGQPQAREPRAGFTAEGFVARVAVGPLDRAAVRQMLRTMGQPALERIADPMADYTGGNPLFIVETVRHLLQSGSFDGSFPASLPPPGRVSAIIERRVRNLPHEALRLAWVFAVARADFNVELASAVLGIPVDQLAHPWRFLEEAQVIRGRAFSHELLAEVLLATLPEPIRQSMEERIAAWWRRSH
jgi:DNA-binding SARP family transcriptional activator